ncbi:MAG TPA: isoprenylcysteine carboxylmethyltransferase family protein [Kineosporiaceae bacterium]|nr:isoprenylcysteine carboxylmethyltransferase family protein [Kineosporiaceae bacterium]
MPDRAVTVLQRRIRDLPGRRLELADALVVAQGLAGAGLLWPGRGRWSLPRPIRRAALAVTLLGTAAGALGARQLGSGLTPRVEPPPQAALRTTGPYAVSRHPIYAGVLVCGAGFAVLRRRPEPLLALAALAGVLHVKAGIEERRLRDRFGTRYDEYARRTPRLIGLPRR